MRCSDCREALSSYLDDELMSPEAQEVREHLATCLECERQHRVLADTSLLLKEKLVRHQAPDVLKARIRSALAQPHAFDLPRATHPVPVGRTPWFLFAAAGLVIAVASSALTFAVVQRGAPSHTVASEVLASHIRSLMPDHLTDIVSTNQHNVKPWFNGRVGISPPVPNLDSAGFVLVGGRLDYIEGRSVAAIVYSRRQHVINVYAWPTSDNVMATRFTHERGYTLVRWRADGVEYWVVSDLNGGELGQFVRDFIAAGR